MIPFRRPAAQKTTLRLRNEQSLSAVCLAKLRDAFFLILGDRTAGSGAPPADHSSRKECAMTSTRRSVLTALAAACVFSAPLAAPAAAQTTKLKLVLNWKYQGPQGMFFLADDKGYFKE